MNDDKNKRGFSGLSALSSDVGEPAKKTTSQNTQSEKSVTGRQKNNVQKPNTRDSEPNRIPSQQSEVDEIVSGTSQVPIFGTRWFWWLVIGVGIPIWLIAISNEDENKPNINPTHTQSHSLSSDSASQTAETQISELEFSKPPFGKSNTLSVAEIRWCLREDIRIEFVRPLLETKSQVSRFNTTVDDYNSRCGRYQYRKGALNRARQDVERVRAQIIKNISLLW